MSCIRTCHLILGAALFSAAGLAVEATSSTEMSDADHVSLLSIPRTLRQIEEESTQLQDQLAPLPELSDTLQRDAYGYHGDYLPALANLPEKPRWIVEVTFPIWARLEQVVLVPAIDHRFDRLRSFGFPERFRIAHVFDDGSSHVVKEWMEHDCPDPGRIPLTIDLPHSSSHTIRIEVFRGSTESGKETFALDEIFGSMQNIIQANSVKVSSEFESLPYWSKDYLIDQKTSLGLPIGPPDPDRIIPSGDFHATFPSDSQGPYVVELDLGRNRRLGWILLFPAMPPQGIMIPGYGFPRELEIEIVPETNTGDRGKPYRNIEWAHTGDPGNNVVLIPCYIKQGRWLRLIGKELRTHNNIKTFALGEIHTYYAHSSPQAVNVTLEGFPESTGASPHLLADHQSNDRPVMRLLDWIHQIEQRDQLERKLSVLSATHAALQSRWKRFWITFAIGAATIIVFAALSVAVAEMVKRRQHATKLRKQISSDLHDDIGSKVAAIGLAATCVEQFAEIPIAKEEGTRIRKITDNMHHSLRDVLWLTDTGTDTLKGVVLKLVDSARSGVSQQRLVLESPSMNAISERPVHVQIKRDLLMFFKEALHNAAEHSEATKIAVSISLHGKSLELTIKDNGKGFTLPEKGFEFDPAKHHGLATMRARSQRLKGKLDLRSSPDTGTTVHLIAPL